MRTRSRGVASSLVLSVFLVAAGCTNGDTPTSRRGPVSLEDMEAVVSDSALSIGLGVPSCNGDPFLDEIVEESDVVRLRVVSTVTNPGDACLDSLEVELDEPLGDRYLVDMTSGAQIPVRSQP